MSDKPQAYTPPKYVEAHWPPRRHAYTAAEIHRIAELVKFDISDHHVAGILAAAEVVLTEKGSQP